MVTVTAAELQKQFGRYRETAIKEPVSITHHGRESLVMLSAEEYKRLKALDTRQAFYADELPTISSPRSRRSIRASRRPSSITS